MQHQLIKAQIQVSCQLSSKQSSNVSYCIWHFTHVTEHISILFQYRKFIYSISW